MQVKHKIDPVHWFLEHKDDVRSSNALEEAATEFDVQGLEIDWAGVTWDADLRRNRSGWAHFEFRGNKWNSIRAIDRQRYLLNSYRVLLTRARKGMVLVVPNGNDRDPTREPALYDQTYEYLVAAGLQAL